MTTTLTTTVAAYASNVSDALLLASTRAHLAVQDAVPGVSGSTSTPAGPSHSSAAEIPDSEPVAPAGLGEAAAQLIGIGKWVGLVLGVGGLIACGIMMAIGRRNNSRLSADGASGVMWVVAGISVVLLSVPIVGAVSGAF